MVRFAIPPNSFLFTVVLGMLAALPPLSIDMNVPTLLDLQAQFGASFGQVGLTITLFMVGFALGQLTAGPLSDRHGRRPVLLAGLTVYALTGAGCALAGSAMALVGWRLMQGIGAGTCAVMAMTMIRDLFDGDVARAKRSYVTVVFVMAPILAPSLGAAILSVAGWRPIYGLLAGAGLLLLLVALWAIPESRDRALPPPRLRATYATLLRQRWFVGAAVTNALSYGALFAFIAGSAPVIMGHMGLSARTYAVVFAGSAVSLTLGAWISGCAARRGIRIRVLLWWAVPVSALTAVSGAVALAAGVPLHLLGPTLLLNVFCRGVISPNMQHLALEPVREHAGTAASAVGVLQIMTGAAASAAVALLEPRLGPAAMTLVMATLSTAALATWFALAETGRVGPLVGEDAD